jgi:hypothetical protein
MAFGLEKPVFRIGVNTMGTLGAIGLTTGVMPSMTLAQAALAVRSLAIMYPPTALIEHQTSGL